MKDCRIEKSINGFKIHGVISFETVLSLYTQGVKLFDPIEKIQIDFIEVEHADSTAIALLLNWLRFATRKGKEFIVHNLPSQLLEIANVCEVMPFLTRYINYT